MKSVALYARVSSDAQAKNATVESQVEALKRRAQADGHIVLPQDVYVDAGFSGATLVRPALERLRDRAAEGGIDLLYIHSPDRLARKYAYQVLLLDEFRQAGIEVVFLFGPTQHTAEDELLVQVQGMIAEYERAKIMERYRRGKIHRARQGLVNPLSGAPYGYLYVKKSDEGPARFQVVLHEAKVVRWVFELLVHQHKSIGEVTRRLNKKKIPTRRGAACWDRTTVWAMLRNPAYMGKAAFGKTESIERGVVLRPIRGKETPRRSKSSFRDTPPEKWIWIEVPALVSAELFEAAQAQLKRNKRMAQRNARGERYLLQGLTVCAQCGYAFYGKTVSRASAKGNMPHSYYRCVGTDAYRFAGERICKTPQVRADTLDEYVWQAVGEVIKHPQRLRQEWARRQASDGVPEDVRQHREEAQRHLTSQEKALQRLLDAYEAGAVDLPDLKARSDRVRERIERARDDLAEAQAKEASAVELRAIAARLEDFASRVRDGLDHLSWLERRQLIRTLVSRVEVDEEEVTVVYRLPNPTPPRAGPAPSGPSGQGANSTGLHRCGRSAFAVAGECLHQPVAAGLCEERVDGVVRSEDCQLCRRLRGGVSKERPEGAGEGEGMVDGDEAGPQSNQDEREERLEGIVRLPGIRTGSAALLWDTAAVPGASAVEESYGSVS